MLAFITNSYSLPSGTLLVFTAVLILVRGWVRRRPLPRGLPPGPSGVPLFGYMLKLGSDYHLKLTELSKTFGSVYQIFLGQKRVVVINDHTLIRQAFRQPVFSGRPDTALTKLLKGLGIINSAGALWKEQRMFLHSVLRDFGAKNMGPNRIPMEENIQTQVSEFMGEMHMTNGSPCFVRPMLARAVSNVVGSMLMGVTFDNNDSDFVRLMRLIEEGFTLLTTAVPVNFIPIFQYIPFLNKGYWKIKQNKAETEAYFAKIAEQHKKTFDPERIRDFVDAFYVQQLKVKELNKESYFSDKQLLQVMGDVYSAGLETVTSTLEWTVLFILRNKEVQRRLHEEIDQVIGANRKPELNDMSLMPYTEATILEVLRRANVIALGNAHATLEDTELGGYFIPKDTHVLPNIWAVHMDPELWDCPEDFKPERFLVNNRVTKPSYFMPFSVGRRMCIGDTLTRMEIFLFLTRLLQEFDLCVPEGQEPPTAEGIAAISMTAKPFQVCAVPRQHP